jgi:drug/metabolite transporter (DMT)-like permease
LTQWLLVLAVVITTIGGDLLQARDMQDHSRAGMSDTALAFFRRPLLIASIFCMALSFAAFLALLRVADLSFAVPATAASFVFETALARWYLNEHVNARRWMAALLVTCGVALLEL